MNLAICSLASGSSGNCYLVRSEQTALLVDAGISEKQIKTRLETLGMGYDQISAVLITHEHSDHIKSLPQLAKKGQMTFCLNRKTYDASQLSVDDNRLYFFHTGEDFLVGDIHVKTFHLSHDAADPTGYTFTCGDKQLSIVTDTGVATEEILSETHNSDIIVLESNHDENILKVGRYPWFLKKRILGDFGHLSNDSAAQVLLKMLEGEIPGEERERIVLLAHLSKENNFPEMALATVKNELESKGYIAGRKILIEVLERTEQSPIYWV